MQTDLLNQQNLQQHEAGLEKAILESANADQSQATSPDWIPDKSRHVGMPIDWIWDESMLSLIRQGSAPQQPGTKI